jgi:DNA end-binding protein Ku
MRKREYVGVLRGVGGHLALIALRHAEEIVTADQLRSPSGPAPAAKEVRLAEQLVDALEADFDPGSYHDQYRDRVRELIAAKQKGRKLRLVRPERRAPSRSLEAALRSSLAKTGEKAPHGRAG